MQLYRVLAVVIGVLSCLGPAAAQIITVERQGDKTVACMYSGLSSDLNDCGSRSDSYTYVFVGSISAITAVENDEKDIQVVPEEVFHGKPPTSLSVLTSQAACLPKLEIGDHWLFFLREEKNKPIVLDYYGNHSRPLADAQEEIEILHRLEHIGASGIVRGRVMQGQAFDGKIVPDARVVALRESDHIQFVSTTNAEGRFEFPPLPSGNYKIMVDPVESTQPDDSDLEVSGGTCWDLTLSRSPHAHLSGHVHRPGGSAVTNVDVVVMSADNSWFVTSQTNASGYFIFNSLKPGEYVIGINLPGAPAWEYGGGAGVTPPTTSLYYNGAIERFSALVIKLAADEERDDLDFVVLPQ